MDAAKKIVPFVGDQQGTVSIHQAGDLFGVDATFEPYQLGGDLTKLEKDNLKLLKEGIFNGLQKNLNKNAYKEVMGF